MAVIHGVAAWSPYVMAGALWTMNTSDAAQARVSSMRLTFPLQR
jgi:hypothetical protein